MAESKEQRYNRRARNLKDLHKHSQRNLAIYTLSNGEPPRCSCCGLDKITFLEIDHVTPQSPKNNERKREHPTTVCRKILSGKNKKNEYQLLCSGCNKKKLAKKKCGCRGLALPKITKEDLLSAFMGLFKKNEKETL